MSRAIQATYPPGSIFKTVQALIALDEGVVSADEQILLKKYNLGAISFVPLSMFGYRFGFSPSPD